MTTNNQQLKDLFVNEKPVEILVNIRERSVEGEECFASQINESVSASYAHTVKTLHRLDALGLLTYHKKGRKKPVELTERGEELADAFLDLTATLEG